jgi:hypothetical protein
MLATGDFSASALVRRASRLQLFRDRSSDHHQREPRHPEMNLDEDSPMTRTTKMTIAASILAALALFFTATAISAPKPDPIQVLIERIEFRLERLETVLAAMQTAMETMLTEMQKAWGTMNDTILDLSDDIGEMADRILLMAEQIGLMADRIVETMEIMTDTLLEIQKTMAAMLLAMQNNNNSVAIAGAGVATGVVGKATLILAPSEGDTLTDTSAFQLTGGYDDFILYASSDAGMAKSTNILIQDNNLADALSRIKAALSGPQVYVAAKAVDGDAVGEISNTVMLYVP